MAALEALVGGLTPANEDIEFLQQTGIIPSVEDSSISTTTTPYASGAGPTNPNTGTTDTGVLQAIQKLDEKMTGGFAQIMAKLSNTPMNGGQIKSPQNIEMSTTTQGKSFFNTLKNGIGRGVSGVTSGVKGLMGTPASNTGTVAAAPAAPAAAAAPAAPAAGGRRRRTRKSRRGRKPSRRRRN